MGKLKVVFDFEQINTIEDLKWVVSTIVGAVEIDTAAYNTLGEKKKFFSIIPEVKEVEEEVKTEE